MSTDKFCGVCNTQELGRGFGLAEFETLCDRCYKVIRERLEREVAEKEKAVEAANNLLAWSSYRGDVDSFIEHILHEHRTNQQTLGGVIIKLLVAWAHEYDHHDFDLRNEAITQFASRVCRRVPPDERRLPYV